MKTTVKLLLLVGLLVWTIVTAVITFAFLQARDEIRGNTISIQQQLQKPQQLQKLQQLQKPQQLDTLNKNQEEETLQRNISKTVQHLIYALGMVEVGTAYQDCNKRGLNGELGPLQITRAYWKDSNVAGEWEDCCSWDYSVQVLTAYFLRYGKEALLKNDFETLARIHNGGPRGAQKPQTASYWEKVQRYL